MYGSGRVALLGDAAHLTAAALGQVHPCFYFLSPNPQFQTYRIASWATARCTAAAA